MSMVGAHVSSLVGVAPHRDARRCTQRCSPELAVSAGTRVTTASIACKAVRQGVQRELAFLGETTPVERQLPFSTQTNPCAGRARQPVVISAAAFSVDEVGENVAENDDAAPMGTSSQENLHELSLLTDLLTPSLKKVLLLHPEYEQLGNVRWCLKPMLPLGESGQSLFRLTITKSNSMSAKQPSVLFPFHAIINPDIWLCAEIQLVELVLDLGRIPKARFPTGDYNLGSDVLVRDDIDYIVLSVGEFHDNRAGLQSTLDTCLATTTQLFHTTLRNR
eukprot:735533-Pyramimonas_sp.AAC.1